jgi:hypothetical protein
VLAAAFDGGLDGLRDAVVAQSQCFSSSTADSSGLPRIPLPPKPKNVPREWTERILSARAQQALKLEPIAASAGNAADPVAGRRHPADHALRTLLTKRTVDYLKAATVGKTVGLCKYRHK